MFVALIHGPGVRGLLPCTLLLMAIAPLGCAKRDAERPQEPPSTSTPAPPKADANTVPKAAEAAQPREAAARKELLALREALKKQTLDVERSVAKRPRASAKIAEKQLPDLDRSGPSIQPLLGPLPSPVPPMSSGTNKSAQLDESPDAGSSGPSPDAHKAPTHSDSRSMGVFARESRAEAMPTAPSPPPLATLPAQASSPPNKAESAPEPPTLRTPLAPRSAPVAAAAPPAASAKTEPPAPAASAPPARSGRIEFPQGTAITPPAESAKTNAPEAVASTPPATSAKTETAKAPDPAKRPANAEQFTMVKVYYGTDRAAVDPSVPAGFSAAAWFWFTSSVAGLTIGLALCCWRFPSSRLLRWASVGGLIVTAGLGVATIQARHRSEGADSQVRKLYSNRRGALELGVCEVSIPKEHTVGVVERPSILKFQFGENPLKHVVLESVREQSPEQFYAELKSRVDVSYRKEAFVFVHGFNVSFDSAARRTAQIAYDLKFDGAPIFYSWPSHGGLLGYTIDETNVVWTVPHLKQFLVDVAQRSGARGVSLVAHSMGNRALTSALRELLYELNDRCPRFREVVLTAPDIDADVFRRDLAPAIVRTADRVTLYASSNDEALVLSKKVHGYPRAGDSGGDLIVLPGMDTIDVSTVDTSLLGHSYYGNNLTVLADLFDLLHEAKPAESRPWLSPVQSGSLRYWIFKQIQEAALGRERL